MSEQSFTDIWGRVWKILNEEYNITEADIKQWDKLAKTINLPMPNHFYTTFIHPEGLK